MLIALREYFPYIVLGHKQIHRKKRALIRDQKGRFSNNENIYPRYSSNPQVYQFQHD